MKMKSSILTNNPCYKAGKKIKVTGLMLHSVGTPQPSAETFVRNWNKAEQTRACVHAFIDGNTGEIYQTLPWEHRAWHCGGTGNRTHIGVEMCEPSCIKYTGGATFTCSDGQTAKAVVKRTYDAAVEIFAFLCKEYNLNPLADGVILSHKEGHDRKIASGHGDPEHLWNQLKIGYTMNGFRKDVSIAIGGSSEGKPPLSPVTEQLQNIKPQITAEKKADGTITAGDIVTLAADSVYYTGKEMPDWVKKERWIVKSVSGDRVVIDQDENKTKAISSPVNIKFLYMAKGSKPKTDTVPSVPVSISAENIGGMHISDKGVELIAKYEGCRLEAYLCPAGVWTIGYGHTEGVNKGDKLASVQEAKNLLKNDLVKYGGYVNSCIKKGLIIFTLTQNQFDALTSFAYNCGNGSLQKLVTDRDAAAISEIILKYNKGGGKVLAGLTKRRQEEQTIFLA